MLRAKRLFVVEVAVESEETATEELSDRVDAFRESVQASTEHGVTLYLATRDDLEEFAELGVLLPNPGTITESVRE